MKTIILNKMFYVRPSTRADGMFDVWKNNGVNAPDQLVVGPFASKLAALEKADELEAKAKDELEAKERASERDSRSMNNATDILLDYLADNPEITKSLLDKAVKHAVAKKHTAEIARRAAELAAEFAVTDREIAAAQAEINKLKGRVLSLQKKRKAIAKEAAELTI